MTDELTTAGKHRVLRCAACGRLIAKLEWDSFRLQEVYRCCDWMNLQPIRLATKPERIGNPD